MKIAGKIIAVLLVLGLATLSFALYRPIAPERLLISGGTILTLDPAQPEVEAVFVRKGRIVAVGDKSDLQKIAGEAEYVDLDGATLIPGLIEPHTHPVASALLGATIDVSGFKYSDRTSIMKALAEAAGGIGLTPWVVAYGWDPLAVPDLDPPTLAELDRLSPDKPMIILTQMLHEIFVNSAGLKAVGLKIEDAKQVLPGFVRDENGRLTGTVKEVEAIDHVVSRIPPASDAITELLVRLQYIKYAKAGYTAIGVTGAVGRHSDPVDLLKRVGDDPDSPLRTYVYLLPKQRPGKSLGGSADYKIKGMKYWMDGSPFTGGAALQGAYENSELVTERLGLPHNHSGPLNYSREDFQQEISDRHRDGHQIAVHAQGERAIDEVLLALEKAATDHPNPTLRHRLEHNALLTKAQMVRAAKLGVTTGFFVDHIYYYGDVLPDLMGSDRMQRYMPLRSAIDAGLDVTLHGDHPATPIGPFRTLKTALDRRSVSGKTISGPLEKITRLEALKAMTLNAAIQLGEQADIGSIEKGKRADFTLLSENPLTVDLARIGNIQIKDVWKNGRRVDTRFVSATHLGLIWDIVMEKITGSQT